MKKALVFVESKDGKIKKSSQEILSLFTEGEFEIHACVLGAEAASLTDQLKSWGAAQVHMNADEKLSNYNPELYRQFFIQVFEAVQPQFVLASSNMLGRDLFPRIAAKFDCAYMSDITEISLHPELVVRRPMFAAKCSAQVTFTDESCKILLVRPNQVPVADANKSGAAAAAEVAIASTTGKTELQSVEHGESEKLDLTEAGVIVSGGRGLKEAENFKLLNDLAEPLNATIGASRAVVDLGWVPHSMQVGQTGKTVAPNLYIACGISGAIQHLAGMSGSKVIVAINKDDKAPIFQKATYGIVGDLFEIVPALAEKIKAVRN